MFETLATHDHYVCADQYGRQLSMRSLGPKFQSKASRGLHLLLRQSPLTRDLTEESFWPEHLIFS
jgi:hypothetical protein